MPNPRAGLLFIFISIFSVPAAAQQVPRDAQAVVILQQSFVAMGGTVPADSVATGTITVVAGSTTETGTARILTRGVDQSAEQIQTTAGKRAVIYSRGQASEVQNASVRSLQMELVVTSQSPDFPLPLLAAALNNSDTAIKYVGLETIGGSTLYHVQFWNAFSANVRLQPLAPFSTRDIWIDSVTGRPNKLSYERRATRGSGPGVHFEVFFSDYRNVNGVLYPFLIQKSANAVHLLTINIQTVTPNNGLTDADFPVR